MLGKHEGEKNPAWRGGITPEDKAERNTIEYRQWRKAVYERDNYTCQECGRHGGDLNAHHIKLFTTHRELRLVLENGITLCVRCHKKTPH